MKAKSSLFLIGSLGVFAALVLRAKKTNKKPQNAKSFEQDARIDTRDMNLDQAQVLVDDRLMQSIGKLSDRPLDLQNILMGVDRGWYKARVDKLSIGYVVYLSGKKTDGEYTEDVYPISKETYDALVARNIGVGYAAAQKPFWYGIKSVQFIYHGDWSDPEIYYRGKLYNAEEAEEAMYAWYQDEKPGISFEKWMKENEDLLKNDVIPYLTPND